MQILSRLRAPTLYTVRVTVVILNPEARTCRLCGERRRLFKNANGYSLRCPRCELEDILAHLRGEVGPQTSAQFLRNISASPWQAFMYKARQNYLAEVARSDAAFLRKCGITRC